VKFWTIDRFSSQTPRSQPSNEFQDSVHSVPVGFAPGLIAKIRGMMQRPVDFAGKMMVGQMGKNTTRYGHHPKYAGNPLGSRHN
jgi:hypothetical protein